MGLFSYLLLIFLFERVIADCTSPQTICQTLKKPTTCADVALTTCKTTCEAFIAGYTDDCAKIEERIPYVIIHLLSWVGLPGAIPQKRERVNILRKTYVEAFGLPWSHVITMCDEISLGRPFDYTHKHATWTNLKKILLGEVPDCVPTADPKAPQCSGATLRKMGPENRLLVHLESHGSPSSDLEPAAALKVQLNKEANKALPCTAKIEIIEPKEDKQNIILFSWDSLFLREGAQSVEKADALLLSADEEARAVVAKKIAALRENNYVGIFANGEAAAVTKVLAGFKIEVDFLSTTSWESAVDADAAEGSSEKSINLYCAALSLKGTLDFANVLVVTGEARFAADMAGPTSGYTKYQYAQVDVILVNRVVAGMGEKQCVAIDSPLWAKINAKTAAFLLAPGVGGRKPCCCQVRTAMVPAQNVPFGENVLSCTPPHVLSIIDRGQCSDTVCSISGDVKEVTVLNGYDTEGTISLMEPDVGELRGYKPTGINGDEIVGAFHASSAQFGKAQVTLLLSSCYSGSLPLGRLPYLSQSELESADKADTELEAIWNKIQKEAESKDLKENLLMFTVATDKDSAMVGTWKATYETLFPKKAMTWSDWVEENKDVQLEAEPTEPMNVAMKGILHPLGMRTQGLKKPVYRLGAWGDYGMYTTNSFRSTIGRLAPKKAR